MKLQPFAKFTIVFQSVDLTFGVGDHVGEVISPAKIGSDPMSG